MVLIRTGFLTTLTFVCLVGGVALGQGNIETCLRNVSPEVQIIDSIYDLYSAQGIQAVTTASGEKGVWWSRWSLEILRWVVTGGENGNTAVNTTACDEEARTTEQWKILNDQFTELEAKVIELETAKGLEFMGLQNDAGDVVTNGTGRTIYKDSASGQVYSWEDSQNF
jgi:hypothetical protein